MAQLPSCALGHAIARGKTGRGGCRMRCDGPLCVAVSCVCEAQLQPRGQKRRINVGPRQFPIVISPGEFPIKLRKASILLVEYGNSRHEVKCEPPSEKANLERPQSKKLASTKKNQQSRFVLTSTYKVMTTQHKTTL